ncbi:MAG: alcohol dehydrogenase catalytic domain-containing protein [Proteobacteria bacterium]|nr:alcohol dehydrogenase catalytic domain-containing protein [Pseudomonadota bacterium]
MKAIVKYGEEPGILGIQDMPEPKAHRGEVVAQIKATGICYTDISILDNKYKGRKPVPIPLILGHEGAGVVIELGEGVNNLSVGDRVGLEVLFGCGCCYDCLNGNKNMCTDWGHIGITCDGTFAEYVVVPADLTHKLPDDVSFVDAAFLEPMGLTVRTLEHVEPMVGDTAAIIGPGPLGMFHLQALKAAGAAKIMVIGLDQDKKRFEIAEKLGADHIINGSREDVVKRVRELTDGLGTDIVVETANSPKVLPLAIEMAAARGRVALFGLYPEATFSPVNLLRSGLSVFGDVGILPRHFIRAMRWVEYKKVLAEPLVTRRFSLDQAEEAFEVARKGETVKVLFEI